MLNESLLQNMQTALDRRKRIVAMPRNTVSAMLSEVYSLVSKVFKQQTVTQAEAHRTQCYLSYTSSNRSCASGSSWDICSNCSASFSSLIFSSSTFITASKAVKSEASISLSSRYVSMCSGISISRLPRALSRLDLPQPLGPSSPYRLHPRRY